MGACVLRSVQRFTPQQSCKVALVYSGVMDPDLVNPDPAFQVNLSYFVKNCTIRIARPP
jgi:hypothetical protein